MGDDKFKNLPPELKACCRWVVFRLLRDEKDPNRFKKVPFRAKSPSTPAFSGKRNDSWTSFDEAVRAFSDPVNKLSGIGLDIGTPFVGLDLDKVRNPETGSVEPWAEAWIKEANTYTELSPSGTGFHLWFKGSIPAEYAAKGGVKNGSAEIYGSKRYFTVTGQGEGELREVDKAESKRWFDRVATSQKKEAPTPATVSRLKEDQVFALLMQGKIIEAGYNDPSGDSEADLRLCRIIAKKFGNNPDLIDSVFRRSGLMRKKWEREDYRKRTIEKALEGLKPKAQELDPDSWRAGCKSKGQLTTELPRFLLGGLIPEKALTFITAPSYHCKTWFALQCAHAISVGRWLWGFDGPPEPVPILYNVPEMNEALVRQYMDVLGIEDSDKFLVRTMEAGIWPLDSPIMERASEGRVVFNDTMGYFNPADDTNEYRQSLLFGTLVYKLLNKGARAVVGLSHITKTAAKNESAWTLEDSVHGSVGYGGILRSCLRMVNLNPDLNDPKAWLYVQGMKNPGLKPFQLEGPMPLKMKVPPGESPYLSELLKKGNGDLQVRVWERYQLVKSYRKVAEEFGKSKSYIENLVKAQERERAPHQQQAELNIEEDDHGM